MSHGGLSIPITALQRFRRPSRPPIFRPGEPCSGFAPARIGFVSANSHDRRAEPQPVLPHPTNPARIGFVSQIPTIAEPNPKPACPPTQSGPDWLRSAKSPLSTSRTPTRPAPPDPIRPGLASFRNSRPAIPCGRPTFEGINQPASRASLRYILNQVLPKPDQPGGPQSADLTLLLNRMQHGDLGGRRAGCIHGLSGVAPHCLTRNAS